MKINVKTKIHYNGRDYSDPSELPPEVRAAFERAISGKAGVQTDSAVKRKFVLNGEEYASAAEMPENVRQLCEDVISVVENNGEVTLPTARSREPLISKRQLQFVFAVVGALVAIALVSLAIR